MRISDWSSDVCSSDLFTQSQGLAVLLAIAFLLLMFAVRGIYSDGLAGNAEVAKLTRAFLLPFVPAMALQIPMFVLSAALRGVGDVRTASLAQLVTVALNMVLDPVLIFGWGSGHPTIGEAQCRGRVW